MANVVKLDFDGVTFIFNLQRFIFMSFRYSWARLTQMTYAQYVFYKDIFQDPVPIIMGIPQGSSLSAIFFNIFIKDNSGNSVKNKFALSLLYA